MFKNIYNIAISYQLDRNCATSKTNTFKRSLYQKFQSPFLTFFHISVNFIIKVIVNSIKVIVNSIKDITKLNKVIIIFKDYKTKSDKVTTLFNDFVIKFNKVMTKFNEVISYFIKFVALLNVFFLILNNIVTTLYIKLEIYVLNLEFSLPHITNLKGHNKYADWDRPRWYNVTSGNHRIA